MKLNLTQIKLVVAIATVTVFTACSSKYEKTPSGMPYKIIKGNGKEKIAQGNIVKFNVEYKLEGKDTILNTTYGKMPGYLPVDTAKLPKYNFTEVITKMCVGDKMEFILSVDSLKKKGQIPDYDKIFVKGGTIKGKLEIVKIYPNEKACQPDYEGEMKKEMARQQVDQEKQMKEMKAKAAQDLKEYLAKNKPLVDKQIAELKDYAAKHNLKLQTTPMGALVAVETEGAGDKAIDGKHAKLMYRGYLVNGKVFDANMGDSAKHRDPIEVVVGSGNTIPGFEECVKYFAKGGKGKFLIPAALAYREKENPGIPANSNIIFDIEVVDVNNGDVQPQMKNAPASK